MSRFLAPIHFWLFNKIKYHEDLEYSIVRALKDEFGQDVEKLFEESKSKYGQPLGEESLEDIIDQSNIHGWLADKIAVAETRQADLIAKAVDKYRENALPIIERVHREIGKKYGEMAKQDLEDSPRAEDIYKILNDYILDGMPCDNVRQVVINEDNRIEYVQTQCLHSGYWERVGLDINLMYEFRAEWTKAFVNALSSEYAYSFERTEIDGRDGQKHIIEKQ